jgi:hypothetical protein
MNRESAMSQEWDKERIAQLVVAGVLLLFVCGAGTLTLPNFLPHLRNKEEDTRKLAQSFPALERLQVREFRSDSDCNVIYYSRGWFADPLKCAPFLKPAKPFDAQAKTDFELLKSALSSARVPIDTIEADFSLDNKVLTATYWLDCTLGCNLRYTYLAGANRQPDEVPGEIWHTRINTNWYLTDEDWN